MRIPRTTLYNGDCMDYMNRIPSESVDMVLCDLPYGTTRNKWDSALSLHDLWNHYRRIVKKNGAIVLFAQTPFDKVLGASNLDMLKYEWIWEKESGTGMLNSKFAPMKIHENILVFSSSAACHVQDRNKAMTYIPQMGTGTPYRIRTNTMSSNYDARHSREVFTENNGTRYPTDILRFARDKEKLHPTQKPVALLQYLIMTYTHEHDVVLDNCMGSGSTGVAAIRTDRKFIGMELDKKYYDIADKRITAEIREKERNLF